MRTLKLLTLTTLLPLSLLAIANNTGISIQTATQSVGMPMGGNAQLKYLITNNTGIALTGLNYTLSSSSLVTMTSSVSCNALTNGASCFFTENMLTKTTGSSSMAAPKVCIGGVACWQPQTPMLVNITSSNSMVCWGQNDGGEFGDDTLLSSSSPVYTLSSTGTTHFSNIQQISGGGEANHGGFTCAVSTAGAVSCWGNNGYGQMGNGATGPNTKLPTANTTLTSGVSAISTGYYHVCALKNGTVYCWGGNGQSQVNNVGSAPITTPFAETLAAPAIAVANGGEHTCALLQNGTIECWGLNTSGQAGNGTTTGTVSNPTLVVGVGDIGFLNNVQAIAAGGFHTCALLTSGKVVCWGANSDGALGNGGNTNTGIPAYVIYAGGTQLTGVQSIEAAGGVLGAGVEFTCAVLTNGTEYCWGYNGQGQLGINNTTNYSNPQQVLNTAGTAPLSSIQAIMGGDCTNCALLTNGTVKCWGQNRSGEVGNGTGTNQYPLPQTVVQVSPTKNTPGPSLTNVTELFIGGLWSYECALIGGS